MLRRILLTAVLCSGAAFVPTAHATKVCVENDTLTFNPPLTLGNQSGSATMAWENTCADGPGLTGQQGSGTWGLSYFGSCAAVILTEGESVLIGGSVYFVIEVGYNRILVLQPDSVCPVATAHGTGIVTVL
jgi:hypothetical protein